MGSKPKAPVVVPVNNAANTAAAAAALPPPAMQDSPTAQNGVSARREMATMAAGLGMNDTILTSPRGVADTAETTRKTLLGA